MRIVMDFKIEDSRLVIAEVAILSREQADKFVHGVETLIDELWPIEPSPDELDEIDSDGEATDAGRRAAP
jgi:hypothetical protein